MPQPPTRNRPPPKKVVDMSHSGVHELEHEKRAHPVLLAAAIAALTGVITSGFGLIVGAPFAVKEYFDERFDSIILDVEKNKAAIRNNTDTASDIYSNIHRETLRAGGRMDRIERQVEKILEENDKSHDSQLHHGFRLDEIEKDITLINALIDTR